MLRPKQKQQSGLSNFSYAAPNADQVEITIIGPSRGECCLVHLGAGRWLIIDSCRDKSSGRPVALQYLERLGVPFTNVDWIVLSHWHDDHCDGISEVFSACSSAKLCLSGALGKDEFIEAITSLSIPDDIVAGSGVDEVAAVYEEMRRSKRGTCVRAIADRRIFMDSVTFGYPVEIWTLSPSDAQFQKTLVDLAGTFAELKKHRKRFPMVHVNDLSIVTLVRCGDIAVLLGGDLEHTVDVTRGWTSIVRSSARPQARSAIFKIPHHGSENGHCEEVWSDMLEEDPICIVTPYAQGRKPLPTDDDVIRIRKHTSSLFVTSSRTLSQTTYDDPSVKKTLRDLSLVVREAEPMHGLVRVRNGGQAAPTAWTIDLDRDAYRPA